jgi:hydroxypyruvate reductase
MATDAPRADLPDLFAAGVARADPGAGVASALEGLPRPDAIWALGKAAVAMTRPALARFPGVPCLVVTNEGNAAPLPGAEVMIGGHPVPDDGSAAGGAALLAAADRLGSGDLALVLISGGGSALATAPAEGVTLSEVAAVSRLLLGAGLDIRQTNLVRQNLSQLAGGGLARAAAPGRVEALILSDVVGDDPAAIASGPTVPPLGGPAAAADLLRECHLWTAMPETCRAALRRPAQPVPEAGWHLIGSNRMSVEAMATAAPGAMVDPDPLVGDVAEAAARVAAAAYAGPGTTLWGGETTVVLRGDGRGGRNQELALRVAVALEGLEAPWAFLSGGTDGRDGPTDAAGGVVDHGTLGRIAAAGLDMDAILARNDSYRALEAAGDLLITGATGTNVADLQVLKVGRDSATALARRRGGSRSGS